MKYNFTSGAELLEKCNELNMTMSQICIEREAELLGVTKEEVRASKKLWVQGVGGDFASRKKISGYYLYDDAIDGVVSDSGYILSLNTYGVNWVAYQEQIIEEEPRKLA